MQQLLQMSRSSISARMNTPNHGLSESFKSPGRLRMVGLASKVFEMSLHFQLELITLDFELFPQIQIKDYVKHIVSLYHTKNFC